ncbi:GPN-Loop GTPase 2 [Vairimorpha necatrix]|uniref:GPN-loop GTPase 2 n=1 Tax=Vairimorpha necatrix TaxID=6039 RepID=A0AAX4J9B9_9MICR
MVYCEIVIGPPGSGKSTYVQQKALDIKHRSPFLINLDPGNIHTGLYDYNISTTTKEYQIKNQKGPNGSTKDILHDFVMDIEDFYYTHLESNEDYLIFDLPGQVEFFIAGGSLSTLVNFLTKKDINVVIVNLIDLVFFNTALISSYLFTYISIYRMEVPFLCVISKCDKYLDYDMNYSLEDISNLTVLDVLNPEKKFEKIATEFLKDYFVYNFQILNYNDKNSKLILQLNIDKCSGYCFTDEFDTNESYLKDIDSDKLFEPYNK